MTEELTDIRQMTERFISSATNEWVEAANRCFLTISFDDGSKITLMSDCDYSDIATSIVVASDADREDFYDEED